MKPFLLLIFRLGWVAFGGAAAHIALLQDELVTKRQWVKEKEFLSLMSLTQLLPGPSSTQLVLAIAYSRYGVFGMVLSGILFMMPAVLLTIVLSAVYLKCRALPDMMIALQGIQVAVLVVIFQAILKLRQKVWVDSFDYLIVAVTLVMAIYFSIPVALIFVAVALISVIANRIKVFSLSVLTLSMMKIGATLFGSGYVLMAYLEEVFIHQLGWLSYDQILDVIAIGQLTPGPVLTTATALGFITFGWQGAVLATFGIFIPGFLLVVLVMPYYQKWQHSKTVQQLLKGVNAAAVAAILAVWVKMVLSVLTTPISIVLLIMMVWICIRYKLSAIQLIGVGVLTGIGFIFIN